MEEAVKSGSEGKTGGRLEVEAEKVERKRGLVVAARVLGAQAGGIIIRMGRGGLFLMRSSSSSAAARQKGQGTTILCCHICGYRLASELPL